MFRFSLRKMLKNRWLTLSLLVGYLMAVAIAIVASMPVYSHAILNRMLRKDLEQIQIRTGYYPGRVTAKASLTAGTAPASVKTRAYFRYDGELHQQILPKIGLPLQEESCLLSVQNLRIAREGISGKELKNALRTGTLSSCSGLFEHISMLEGSLPSSEAQNGWRPLSARRHPKRSIVRWEAPMISTATAFPEAAQRFRRSQRCELPGCIIQRIPQISIGFFRWKK